MFPQDSFIAASVRLEKSFPLCPRATRVEPTIWPAPSSREFASLLMDDCRSYTRSDLASLLETKPVSEAIADALVELFPGLPRKVAQECANAAQED